MKASQIYFQTQVSTVGQGELLLLLYDGGLKFLAQAKEKMQEKDYAAKGMLISKALDVISELTASLNVNAGGELAKNLAQLYLFCSSKLLEANMRMDIEALDTVINVLSGLRNAYAQIVHTPEAKTAGESIVAKHKPVSNSAQRGAPLGGAITPMGAHRNMGKSAYKNAAFASENNVSTLMAQHAKQDPPKIVSMSQAIAPQEVYANQNVQTAPLQSSQESIAPAAVQAPAKPIQAAQPANSEAQAAPKSAVVPTPSINETPKKAEKPSGQSLSLPKIPKLPSMYAQAQRS